MTEAAEEQARIDLAAEQRRRRLLSEAQLAAAEIRRNAEAEAEQTLAAMTEAGLRAEELL